MKKITWADLDESSRDQFVEDFYDLWRNDPELAGMGDDLDGGNNPSPWGCPWDWCGTEVATDAEKFFAENRAEIVKLAKAEKEDR